MLQSMRENLRGVVAYVLVGLIIVIFALFGAEALFMGGLTQDTVAEVNGRKITELDLRRAVEMRKQQLRQMLGENIDPRFLDDEMLVPALRESLIQQEVMASAAEESGLRVGNDVLDKAIVEDSTFHQNGKFDPEYYKSLLRQYGYTPASYRDELRTRQLLNQYQDAFSGTGFVTDRAVTELGRVLFEKRSFDYVILPLDKMLAEVSATDEEIQSYYDQHREELKTEAQAAVEYILLDKAAVTAGATPSEEDIRAQYDAEIKEAGDRTERHAAHILVEEKADDSHLATLAEIQKKLAAGEEFAALAKIYSTDSASAVDGGDVGTTTGSSFVPEFEQALKTLKVGEVSQPVKTQFGYHLVKLLGEKKAPVPTLEESRARIRQALQLELMEDRYNQLVDALKEATDVSSLAALASELSSEGVVITARETALFSRRNPLPLISTNPLLRNPQVIDAVFAENVGTGSVTDVLELSPNHVVKLRVKEFRPAEVQALEMVRNEVASRVAREKASAQLGIRASELLQRLLANETLEALARSEKAAAHQHQQVSRNDASVNSEVLKKVFSMSLAADRISADTLVLSDGNQALIRLREVHTPSTEQLTDSQKSEVLGRLQGSARNSELSAVMAMYTESASIKRRKQADTVSQ